jgi:hypothetical protein
MNPEWKLRMLKLAINVPFRILNRFLKFPAEPKYQQTRMILSIYDTLIKTYNIEVSQGIFAKDVRRRRGPFRSDGGDADGNFERLLTVSAKMLAQLSERDKYYRAWLGLLFILAAEELNNIRLTDQQLQREISFQWKEDLNFLPEKLIHAFRRDFEEVFLADYLGNIACEAQSKARTNITPNTPFVNI